MFEDDSFLDLEFALNENRIVSNQLLYLVSLFACLIIVSRLPVRTGIMALAAIVSASLIAMNATVLPNEICFTSARSSDWASTSVRPLQCDPFLPIPLCIILAIKSVSWTGHSFMGLTSANPTKLINSSHMCMRVRILKIMVNSF